MIQGQGGPLGLGALEMVLRTWGLMYFELCGLWQAEPRERHNGPCSPTLPAIMPAGTRRGLLFTDSPNFSNCRKRARNHKKIGSWLTQKFKVRGMPVVPCSTKGLRVWRSNFNLPRLLRNLHNDCTCFYSNLLLITRSFLLLPQGGVRV